jgi:superfamily II DNA helicase RecQ
MLLLTATLTLDQEKLVKEQFNVPNIKVFRKSCDRPTIKYQVTNLSNKIDVMNKLTEKVQNLQVQLKQENKVDKAIIYTLTIDQVNLLKAKFRTMGIEVSICHSKLTNEERAIEIEKFINGETTIMVSTNGFGTGLDLTNVRWIFHFGGAHNLLCYVQECGRGGRAGEVVICEVFTCPEYEQSFPSDFWLIVNQKTCIRQFIVNYIEQAVIYCCYTLQGFQNCSYCDNIEFREIFLIYNLLTLIFFFFFFFFPFV